MRKYATVNKADIDKMNFDNQVSYEKEITYGREDDDWGDYPFPERSVLGKDCPSCDHPRTWCTCSDAEKRRIKRKEQLRARQTKIGDKMFKKD